ncbi:hypothetical protein ACQRVR_002283 [Enterobacter cloacae]
MDESRKQFAEAFEELIGWELEDYPNQDYADTCWEFWKESRAAIEIELPDSGAYDSPKQVVKAFEEELRAAGIKLKE